MKIAIELDDKQVKAAIVEYVNARFGAAFGTPKFSVWDVQVQHFSAKKKVYQSVSGTLRVVGSKHVL